MKSYVESRMTGIQAYSDRYIIHGRSLYFASVFGNAESVKGTLAGFCNRYDWKLDDRLYHRVSQSYVMSITKISQAVTHGVIYVPSLFATRDIGLVNVIYGDSKNEIKEKAFSRLKKRTAVPLLDSWSGIILKETCAFTELKTFGVPFAYEVELPADDILEQYVMDNIKTLKGYII